MIYSRGQLGGDFSETGRCRYEHFVPERNIYYVNRVQTCSNRYVRCSVFSYLMTEKKEKYLNWHRLQFYNMRRTSWVVFGGGVWLLVQEIKINVHF